MASSHAQGIVLAAALAVVVFVVARRSLGWAFAVLLGALVASNSSIPALKTRFLEARWGALLALAVALVPLALRSTVWRNRFVQLIVALPLLAALSAGWSVEPRLTLERTVTFTLLLFIVICIAAAMRNDEGVRRGVYDGVIALIGFVAITSLAALADGRGTYNHQLRGIFENANGLGLFAGLVYPFVAAELERRGRLSFRFAAFAIIGAVAVLSHSRSGLLALGVSALYYEVARGLGRRFVLVICACAIALVAATVSGSVGSTTTTTPPTPAPSNASPAFVITPGRPAQATAQAKLSFMERLTGSRSDAWQETFHFIAQRPAVGYGFGTGDRIFSRYGVSFRFFEGNNPNNAYLQLLLELGIVGFAVFLVPVVVAGRQAVHIARAGGSRTSAAIGALFVASLATALVESTFTSAGAPWAPFIWIAVAVLGTGVVENEAPVEKVWIRWRPVSWGFIRRRRVLGVVGVLAAIGIAIGVVLATSGSSSRPPSERDEARLMAIGTCGPACAILAESPMESNFWWVRFRSHAAGPQRCVVVDTSEYASPSVSAGVRSASCSALPLRTPHVLTVAILSPTPPYFGSSANDPVGFEAEVVTSLAAHIGVGIVRWMPAFTATVPRRADVVMHVLVHQYGAPLAKSDVVYYPAQPVVVMLKGARARRVRRLQDLRQLRLGYWDEVKMRYVKNIIRPAHPVLAFADANSALVALRGHQIDALIGMRPDSAPFVAQNEGLVAVGLLPAATSYVMRFPLGSRLEQVVVRSLRSMVTTGELMRLELTNLGRLPLVPTLPR